MKILFYLIWFLFVYFCYILLLTYGIFVGLGVFSCIFIGSILSQVGYKKYYKINKKWYEFLLYPSLIILFSIGLFFVPDSYTSKYQIDFEQKEIIFLGMQHIGTQKYYQNMIQNIKKYREKGYIIVYEGIQMESQGDNSFIDKELNNIFDSTDFLSNKYLISQNQMLSYELQPKDKNIDISSTKIQEILKNNLGEHTLDKGGNILKKIQKYSNRHILNYKSKYIHKYDYFFIKNFYNVGFFLDQNIISSHYLDSILIDYRNKYLAENIANLVEDKILILYGEGHIQGFYQELMKISDNKTRIQKLKNYYPFKLK